MQELNNINKLYPLLQSNSFPFLEKTFDDIDEYAILARLQKAINDVIENNNALNNNFTELNNYVTDYFKNLDVQDEIDNKLQEMANNGELTNLIKKYVDPIYQDYEKTINETVNNQNIKINTLENKIISIASGSPLVANSIDEMADTSKIYVNTTDGNWYYYNGSIWTVGGKYQSTGIGDVPA